MAISCSLKRTDFIAAPCRFGGLELRLGAETVNVPVNDFLFQCALI